MRTRQVSAAVETFGAVVRNAEQRILSRAPVLVLHQPYSGVPDAYGAADAESIIQENTVTPFGRLDRRKTQCQKPESAHSQIKPR